MAMSILHRITGAGLYVGTVLVAWWFMAIAAGPEAYETASWFFGSWIGLIILFGYSWALMHHLLGGMRHFLWDFGYGLEKTFATKLAWFTIIGSAALTVLIWIIGLMVW
jgi:succinate dehydrogenase / fumarate reductase cytochrome b subunit